MKKLLSGRIAIVVVAVIATVAFFSFKSGDDRNFQIAKNLDIYTFGPSGRQLRLNC